MAFVTAPDFPIKTITWSLDRPGTANVSPFTGKRSVVTNPWHSKWSAHVELAEQQGEENFRQLRSFFLRCRGSINTFRLYATAGAQNDNSGVTLAADAAAGDTTVTIAGAATPLLDGQYFTLNGQLCGCTADQAGGVVTFEPMLRAGATTGTTVVTSRPYALVYLVSSIAAYSIGQWRRYGMTFDVDEAILEADGSAPESGASEEPGSTAGEPIGLLLTLTKAA